MTQGTTWIEKININVKYTAAVRLGKYYLKVSVVVTQLAERSLPAPFDQSSNPVIGNYIKEREARNGQFTKRCGCLKSENKFQPKTSGQVPQVCTFKDVIVTTYI